MIKQPANGNYIDANPQIVNYTNPVITDTLNWVKVSGIYKAHGGEKFITIGNFKDDSNTDTLNSNVQGAFQRGAYFLDDVSVIPIEPDGFTLAANAGPDTTVTTGDSVFIGTLLGGTISNTWYNSAGQSIATDVPGLQVSPPQDTYYILQQTICGTTTTDTVYVTVNALPLRLLTFTARVTSPSLFNSVGENQYRQDGSSGAVLLCWITARETPVDHFEIQRSSNGRDYYAIGKLHAGKTSYTFTDNNPNAATNYYRLRMIDKDGKFTYSPVRIAEYNTSLSITIYPNPAKDKLQVQVNSDRKAVLQMQILSTDGKVFLSNNVTSGAGSILQSININSLQKGTYILKVTPLTPSLQSKEVQEHNKV